MKAALLYPASCFLGEGPVWHAGRNSCFWVDIENGQLYEYGWAQKTVKKWAFPYKVTFAWPGNGGHLILALNKSIARFNLHTEELSWITHLDAERANNRCNDGACDSRGRLWIGTMDMAFKEGCGALYCLPHETKVEKKFAPATIANGIAWSAANTRLYFIDSPTQQVQAFLFDEETGAIQFEKTAVSIPKELGTPDGMAIDAEGMLWVAHWGGFGVCRWNPVNGTLLAKIEVPVPNVTSCAFAGPALDHLIITTARQDLDKAALATYPDSGGLFIATPGVRGRPLPTCAF